MGVQAETLTRDILDSLDDNSVILKIDSDEIVLVRDEFHSNSIF